MRARVSVTITVLCLYVLLFNIYIYELTQINIQASKLFYNYLTLFMFVFIIADIKSGFVSSIHKQLNNICILCLIINYILIILTHHTILQKPKEVFFMFDGSVLAVTVLIFINLFKHDYF